MLLPVRLRLLLRMHVVRAARLACMEAKVPSLSAPAMITHLAPLVALAALDPLLQLLLLDSPVWASRQHAQGIGVLLALLHQVQQRRRVAPAGIAAPGCRL